MAVPPGTRCTCTDSDHGRVCIVLESKQWKTTAFEPNSGIVPTRSDLYIVAAHALASLPTLPPIPQENMVSRFTLSRISSNLPYNIQDKPYGRNRQSIADIEESLYSIFNSHPKSQLNPDGEPVIPADALVDVLFSFSDAFNGVPLLSDEEQAMLEELLRNNPGLEVSPGILLQFIAQKTAASPSPPDSPGNDDMQLPDRGRTDDRDLDHRRSPSTDSNNGYSRPPSRGPPQTPGSGKSPFDAERRQRSAPLTAAPPSSWSKRPTPARRRKSDAGSRSDSEVCDSFLTCPWVCCLMYLSSMVQARSIAAPVDVDASPTQHHQPCRLLNSVAHSPPYLPLLPVAVATPVLRLARTALAQCISRMTWGTCRRTTVL